VKILLTGGSGLLGTELQKYIECDAPPHKELDITKPIEVTKAYDVIIHAAAYTDVVKAEKEREKCALVNIQGTLNLLRAYSKTKFVYISTEYVYEPVNFYTQTKFIAEKLVRNHSSYLIIRTLFKATPFPYSVAFFDQWTKGDYVDVIAPLIVAEILQGNWNNTINIGTGKKTILDLARRTKPDILAKSIHDIKDIKLPTGETL